jgi:hypothetical protein
MGWREWLSFPALGVAGVKAKIDTGARSSALHAEDIKITTKGGLKVVKFRVFPLQRSKSGSLLCEAVLHDERWIKSSNGKRELRPVIRTTVSWREETWEIDLTLTSRDLMGFRMLLGREAMRKRFVIDPGRSYLGRPRKRSS